MSPFDRRSVMMAIVGGFIVPIQVGAQTVAYTFDAHKFFDLVRQNPFPGILSQVQVDGMTYLLRAWKRKHAPETGDLRWLAYLMATTFHETAYTMQPIEEYGTQSYLQSKPYFPYTGRGYCQLTWDYNYEKAGKECDADLLNFPDMALQPEIAAQVIYYGMIEGWFTGKKFSDYFNDTVNDPVNARRIINGNDRDDEIAGYHNDFLTAIQSAITPIP